MPLCLRHPLHKQVTRTNTLTDIAVRLSGQCTKDLVDSAMQLQQLLLTACPLSCDCTIKLAHRHEHHADGGSDAGAVAGTTIGLCAER